MSTVYESKILDHLGLVAAMVDELELVQQIDLTSAPFVNAVELVEDAGVLSTVQGAAVLALGNVSLPRDEAIGLGHVRESYITAALAL